MWCFDLSEISPVLSLLIVNINNLPATRYDTVFKTVGLDTMSYAPTTQPLPATGWPTLGSLIDSGKRLLTFIDNTANPTDVPYIIDGERVYTIVKFNLRVIQSFPTFGKLRTMSQTPRLIARSTEHAGTLLPRCILSIISSMKRFWARLYPLLASLTRQTLRLVLVLLVLRSRRVWKITAGHPISSLSM